MGFVCNTARRRPHLRVGLLIGAALFGAAACEEADGDSVDGFTPVEWKRIKDMEPLSTAAPRNPSNSRAEELELARLGQKLFMDTSFSTAIVVDGPSGLKGEVGKVACVTCHDPKKFFVDSRLNPGGMSHGVNLTGRHSPSLINNAWYEWPNWDGRNDSLVMQGANAPEAPTDVGANRLQYAHVLFRKYRIEYDQAFPTMPLPAELDPMHADAARFPMAGRPKASMDAMDGPWEGMKPEDRRAINQIMYNVGRTLEAYERQLVARNSPFERYVKNGELGALTASAKSGLKLFVGKAACNECHTGPTMSDSKFHNIGVHQRLNAMGMQTVDIGRMDGIARVTGSPYNSAGDFSDDKAAGMTKLAGLMPPAEETRGAFRTPTLHAVAETGPYMHTGAFATLDDVLKFYNDGGGEDGKYSGAKDKKVAKLNLTNTEIADIIEFLRSLTPAPVPAEWQEDTSKKTL
jgi:cytochrome c peroxidase